jgi:uncharacterized protein with ATP-grasp and redox domains
LARADYGVSPPHIAREIFAVLQEQLDDPDPYLELKQRTNEQVLALLPTLEARVRKSEDPFRMAAKLALAGNIIDFGIPRTFELEPTIDALVSSAPAIDEIGLLEQRLAQAGRVLYLADNAGEIVLDRLFIEQFPSPGRVTVAVRGGPALNDATRADAEQTGLTALVRVIDSGLPLAGTWLAGSSNELQQAFAEADVIVSKGQGNFETLHEEERFGTFFMFMVKCAVVASFAGLNDGDAVVATRTSMQPSSRSLRPARS